VVFLKLTYLAIKMFFLGWQCMVASSACQVIQGKLKWQWENLENEMESIGVVRTEAQQNMYFFKCVGPFQKCVVLRFEKMFRGK